MRHNNTDVPTLKFIIESLGTQLAIRSFDTRLMAYIGGIYAHHVNCQGTDNSSLCHCLNETSAWWVVQNNSEWSNDGNLTISFAESLNGWKRKCRFGMWSAIHQQTVKRSVFCLERKCEKCWRPDPMHLRQQLFVWLGFSWMNKLPNDILHHSFRMAPSSELVLDFNGTHFSAWLQLILRRLYISVILE